MPGKFIPCCSIAKNWESNDLPFLKIPLPKTNDVLLSTSTSTINLLLTLLYCNEYGTGNCIELPPSKLVYALLLFSFDV